MKMMLLLSAVGPSTAIHFGCKQNFFVVKFLPISMQVLVSTLLVNSSHPLNLSIARESIKSLVFSFPKTYVLFLNI